MGVPKKLYMFVKVYYNKKNNYLMQIEQNITKF